MTHSLGLVEQVLDVYAHDRCWNDAEVGQRRITTADIRHARQDVAEPALLRQYIKQ